MAIKQGGRLSSRARSKAVAGEGSRAIRVRAQRLSPDQRRQQLLQCAMEVFSTKGLGEGKHADLAEIAAVAVPTTFHYFPTREDLIGATLEEVARFLIEEIVARNVDRSQSAPMIIKRVLLAFTDAIDDHPHHIRVWLEWSSSIRDGLWNRYLKFYNVAIRRIKTIINTGKKEGSIHQLVDTEDASRIIVGLAHMITQMKFAGNSRATIEHTIDSLVRGYLGAWRE